MADTYDAISIREADRKLSSKSETAQIDLTRQLGLTEMRARVWFVEPGNIRKNFHRHATQEELYLVIEGPGRMQIGDETLDVPEGMALRLPPEMPRRVFNDTDTEHVWLVVGAPPTRDDGRPVTPE